MNELDPRVQRLLQQARRGLTPSDDDARRIELRVQGALHSPSMGARDASSSWLNASQWLNTSQWRPGLLGTLVGLGIGLGAGYQWGQSTNVRQWEVQVPEVGLPQPQAAHDDLAASAPPIPTTFTPPAAVTPVASRDERSVMQPKDATAERPQKGRYVQPSEQARARVESAPTPDHQETATQPAVDELEHVRQVQQALAQDLPRTALGLLDDLDRAVPEGRLGEERAAARAIARCMVDPSRGALEYDAWAQRYPSSVHERRVAGVCGRSTDPTSSGKP